MASTAIQKGAPVWRAHGLETYCWRLSSTGVPSSYCDSQVTMALASGRPPARREAQQKAGQDPHKGADILAFAKVIDQGVAMPNHPAANAVWDPMKQALELISKGETEAAPELQRADQQIREKIQRMVE